MKPIEYQVSEVFSGALVNADLYKSLGATEYSKPPAESLTQPSGSGCAQSSASEVEENWMEVCGNESHTRMVSGDKLLPIWSIGNRLHRESVPLERFADCGTGLSIPCKVSQVFV